MPNLIFVFVRERENLHAAESNSKLDYGVVSANRA